MCVQPYFVPTGNKKDRVGFRKKRGGGGRWVFPNLLPPNPKHTDTHSPSGNGIAAAIEWGVIFKTSDRLGSKTDYRNVCFPHTA